MSTLRLRRPILLLLASLLPAPALAFDDAKPAANGPLAPAEAAKRMTLPEGFHATLFAGEPDVRQPIAFTIDGRGRLWVAENFSYPSWLQPPTEPDRVVILEDTDGDGTFDRRKVFWEKKGANLTGIALGFGGVWLTATPQILFVPDKDGDDVPDGEPVVKLDGWDVKAQHNLVNALAWGPDGWLYGCNGILSKSLVGRPGTPDAERVRLDCGVWRYHPTRGDFEAVAHGTTNPWGLDFDEYGEAFITNCVIPHLFRVVPGAHYQRMFGQDVNPHAYGLIESCADHLHWAGGHWTESREGVGKHGEMGGGHAHTGAMVYLGDNWPDRYRNSVFLCNLHGHRVNNDTLTRVGSGYIAKHGKDFLLANDSWFRGMELKYGPDGSVYLTDWCDTGECHDTDSDLAHRENGRIFRVAFGTPKPVRVNIPSLPDAELVRLQLHKNDWYVRQARLVLQERAAAGTLGDAVHKGLREILRDNPDETRKLRALWSLHGTGGLDEAALVSLLDQPGEYLRAWSVRLLGESKTLSPSARERLAKAAREDASPLVRLHLASIAQRIPAADRWPIVEALSRHPEDARDPMLPLMVWYAAEALVPTDLPRAVSLAAGSQIPVVRQYIARRAVAGDTDAGLAALIPAIARSDDPSKAAEFLVGILEAVRGRRRVPMPAAWPAALDALAKSSNPAVREEALQLSLIFGEPRAAKLLLEAVSDTKADSESRGRALRTLVEAQTPGLVPTLEALLDDPALRAHALRALSSYEDPGIPRVILDRYPRLSEAEREDAVATLASRPAYARALLDAVAAGKVPRRDVSTPIARQIHAFGDAQLQAKLESAWGTVRAPSGASAEILAKYKALLSPESLKAASPTRGRTVFNRTCQQCHRLYDAGGNIGPDLTGSDRANLEYVLGNVLDPNASVGFDYRLTIIATNDGRLLSGLIREQNEKTIVFQTVNDRLVLAREDIDEIKPTTVSMMPEGLFDKLTAEEIRDLVSYLATKAQVAPASGK